jgi:hypothetical protein
MEPRQQPLWLRIVLNSCGPAGLGVTLMGWVRPAWGAGVMAIGLVYVVWEIAPWTTKQIFGRPSVSLAIFMAVGAGFGAAAWWIWKSSATVPTGQTLLSPQVIWVPPAPIVAGTPLSATQLNAASTVDGFFVYKPPAGTVLPVGINDLTAMFYARDSAKYMVHTEYSSIVVTAAATPLPALRHFKDEPKPSEVSLTAMPPITVTAVNVTQVMEVGKKMVLSISLRNNTGAALEIRSLSVTGIQPSYDDPTQMKSLEDQLWALIEERNGSQVPLFLPSRTESMAYTAETVPLTPELIVDLQSEKKVAYFLVQLRDREDTVILDFCGHTNKDNRFDYCRYHNGRN